MNEKDLAEIIGIMLGDGNLFITKNGICQIRISGHIDDDKEYLLNWVKPLFEKTFNVKAYQKLHESKNEMFVCINSQKVGKILVNSGFPEGRKSKNKVKIPKWIFKNKNFLRKCIRGLIDTDGFVYPIRLSYDYPRIGFVSSIQSLRKSYSAAMAKLGFHPSKWTIRKSGWTNTYSVGQCTISRMNEVSKYRKEIGFKNPKYIRDFNRFSRLPSSSPVNSSTNAGNR